MGGGGRGDTPRTRGEPLLDQRHAVPSACQLHLDARQRAALTAELCCHRAGLTGPTQRLPAGREPPAAWGGRRGGAQRWGVPSLSPHGQSGGGCRAGWSLTSLPRCAGDVQQLPQQPLLLQVPGGDTATSPSPPPPHSPAYFGPPPLPAGLGLQPHVGDGLIQGQQHVHVGEGHRQGECARVVPILHADPRGSGGAVPAHTQPQWG